MNKKLIIFDLDGTLLNTLSDLHCSVNFALETEGLPPRSLGEVRSFVGNGILNLIQRSVPTGTDERKTLAVFEVFKAHYAEHCTDSTLPYEGIEELLRGLKSKGCLLGVVSNKAHGAAVHIIERYFPRTFDSVIGEREGVRKKPAPDSVLEVMRLLDCSPEDCFYIGDSEVDILTAQNAGCDCISVSWGFKSREFLVENGAKLICDSVAELGKMLEI